MSVAVSVDIATCTLSLLTSQEQMREHPMAQIVYLHKPRKASFENAYCAAIKNTIYKQIVSADFSSGTNSRKLSLILGLAKNDKQHSSELYISEEYKNPQ